VTEPLTRGEGIKMPETKSPYLSVVVPAYNEEGRLPSSLDRIVEHLARKGWPSEIIVVDDGSADSTSEVAAAHLGRFPHKLLKNEVNRGKGFSVRRGMLASAGEIALFTDADLSTPIEDVELLLQAHEAGADVAIASRAADGAIVVLHQPWLRERLGKVFNLFIRTLVLGGIKDTQCGFKSFRRETVEPIFSRLTIERWAFDVEILFLAKRLGYHVAEVPVHWVNSPCTKVSAATDGLRMAFDALRIRFRHRGRR
jgi:dolichyl-phosphate beta-glucosyltransferase